MRNKLTYILLILLLLAAHWAIGQGYEIDKVCMGAERHYRIDGDEGSEYIWQLFADGDPEILQEGTGDVITILWDEPTIHGVGIFNLMNIQTGANGCDTTHLGYIEVFNQPIAYAGEDITLCSPEPIWIEDATASDYSSLTWTTNGDGTFDDITIINPTYALGENDILNGTVTLTLTATGLGNEGSCPPAGSNFTININSLETVITLTPVTCFGEDDGTATFTASGGTEPYTYNLDGEDNETGEFINLTGGTYTYIIRDAAGCEITEEIIITQPDELLAEDVLTHNICFGGSIGEIDLTISGGTEPYDVTWTGPDTFNGTGTNITGLVAGEYTATILDNNGCELNVSYTITEPEEYLVVETLTHNACYGSEDGTISLVITGGTEPYTVSWTGPDSYTGIGLTITDLASGEYIGTITDDNGCELEVSYIITESGEMIAEVTLTHNACYGSEEGAITLVITGGTEPYTVSWTGPDSYTGTGLTITDLASGEYIGTITDDNGCELVVNYTITEPEEYFVVETLTHNACFGSEEGTIALVITGGTEPYTVSWTGPDGYTSNGLTITDLGSGEYIGTIIDDHGCELNVSYTITEPEEYLVVETLNHNACFGSEEGVISLVITGGTEPYTVSWIGPDGYTGTGLTITDLGSGEYIGTITDDHGCELNVSYTITEPEEYLVVETLTHNACFGSEEGVISLVITGGTEPHTVSWIGPDGYTGTGLTITDLASGEYIGTITDDNGCEMVVSYIITESGDIFIEEALTHNICFGSEEGSITLIITGGTEPYTVTWAGPDSYTGIGLTITDLASGEYIGTITDDNGCERVVSYTITEPEEYLVVETLTHNACYGSEDGTIALVITGGTEPYTVSWIGPDGYTGTGLTITDLGSGEYIGTITDDHGCELNVSYTITEPEEYFVVETLTHNACFGSEEGVISLVITGGTEPYTVSWIGSDGYTGTGLTITDLGSGEYIGTITDDHGCELNVSYTITEPEEYLVVETLTHNACFGSEEGVISLVITGGTEPYTVSWTGPDGYTGTGLTITDLASGEYIGTITDDNGCEMVVSYIITESGDIFIEEALIHNICFGSEEGSITLIITGGTGPYTVTWAGPDSYTGTGLTITDLASGEYIGTITDDNGCELVVNYTITEPEEYFVVETLTHNACFGSEDGTIALVITGGTEPYTVSWIGPDGYTGTGLTITDLGSGEYIGTIIDDHGCELNVSYTITEPEEYFVVETLTHNACFGSEEGVISLVITGGTEPYTVSWIGPDGYTGTGLTITDLGSGEYIGTITDDHGCELNVSYTITEPEEYLVVETLTHNACFGSEEGVISLVITGGTEPYTVSWIGPDGYTGTGLTITDLASGEYIGTITDDNGCEMVVSYIITESGDIFIEEALTHNICFGSEEGSISLIITGGTGPYTVTWAGPDSYTGTGLTITDLASGDYIGTITDDNGCELVVNYTITEPEEYFVVETLTHNACFGSKEGTIALVITGGTEPYTVSWIGPDGYTGTGLTITDLGSGEYIGTITDDHGCELNVSYTITEPEEYFVVETLTHNACFGSEDGTIALVITGGTEPYTVSWIGPDGYTGTGLTITDLGSGEYIGTITDDHGCELNVSYTITEPEEYLVVETLTHNACFGSEEGVISLVITGGTEPYTVSWIGPDGYTGTGLTITDLASGEYIGTITDDNGCEMVVSYIITESGDIFIEEALTHNICFGSEEGSISLIITGGTGPYTVTWAGPDSYTGTGLTITDLASGDYIGTITDDNGCELVVNYTITEPEEYFVVETLTHNACFGSEEGTIALVITGGTEPYTVSWIGPDGYTGTGLTITDLGSGEYIGTIIDDHGCELNVSYTITEPEEYFVVETLTHNACFGSEEGVISLVITGGTEPYTVSWIGPDGYTGTGLTITDLGSGEYIGTITDDHGCELNVSYTITEPEEYFVVETLTHNACFGSEEGVISLVITGGTEPYTISWTGPDGYTGTGLTITDLASGEYIGTITDDNGCELVVNYTITEPEEYFVVETLTHNACFGSEEGVISLVITGGSEPYTVSWIGPDGYTGTGLTITDLANGEYIGTIIDYNGCELNVSYTITEPEEYLVVETLTHNACFGSEDGTIALVITGGTAPYTVSWTGPDGYTGTGLTITDLASGEYIGTIIDDHGCELNVSYTITEPEEYLVVETLTHNACFGSEDGTIALVITGGTAPYTVSWTGPDGYTGTGLTITDLGSGEYIGTITDDNDCELVVNYIITESGDIFVEEALTHNICFGSEEGVISLVITGGTEPYTVSWTGPDSYTGTGLTITDLGSGEYIGTITDDYGCERVVSYTITEPEEYLVVETLTYNACFGSEEGVISLVITGGTAPYTVSWIGPDSYTGTGLTITDLASGEYIGTITDDNGCELVVNYTITEPEEYFVVETLTHNACFGSEGGTITLVITGGTEPFTVTWTGPDSYTGTGLTITDLASGEYIGTIIDDNGCERVVSYTITEPEEYFVVETLTHNACFGSEEGVISLVITGGTEPYTVSWIGPDGYTGSGLTITNLASGEYIGTITDDNGCEMVVSYIITESGDIFIEEALTHNFCFGSEEGSITLIITGGTGPYTVSWTGPDSYTGSGLTITDLASGEYIGTITDDNGCERVVSYTITEPEEYLVVETLTYNACFGSEEGVISLVITGGTAPYTVSWIGPDSYTGTGLTITDLASGEYIGTIIDDNGCELNVSYTITEPEELFVVETLTHNACFGSEGGTITLVITGGTEPFTVSWTGPDSYTGTGLTITDLASGEYIGTITDDNGCQLNVNYTITEPDPLLATFDQININCFGAANGSISMSNPTGGSGNNEYRINSGLWQTELEFTGLDVGNYLIEMRDADDPDCVVELGEVTITEPDVLYADVAFTNETYPGANDGIITITNAEGGSGSYEYSLDGIIWQASGDFTGLAPGSYDVYIRDANAVDCFIILTTVEIFSAEALIANVDFTNVTCFGDNNGTITISNPQNGSGNYQYSIDGGATWQDSGDYTGLIAGEYIVMLRDADVPVNAVTLVTITITEPDVLYAVVAFMNETYPGANDGTITVSSPTGGSGDYEYSLDGIIWQATGDFTGLAPGSYDVYIRDANAVDCFIILTTIEILPADELTADVDFTNVTCFGDNDGTITISDPQNGSGNYEYSIDGGITWQNTGDYIGLIAGEYIVMLRDADVPVNAVTLATITINEPAVLYADVAFTNETYLGASDGTITVSAPTGGSGDYEYSLDGIIWQATGDFTGLAPGSYDVYIRDANAVDCFIILTTIEILPADELTADVDFTNVTCFGDNDGTITISDPQNGSGNYEYSIDGGATWQDSGDYTGLIAGEYIVMLRDADVPVNAVTLVTITITEPDVLYAVVAFMNETYPGANDGTITVSSPTGGSGDYEYSLDGTTWQDTGDFTNLAPGSYDVYIRDANVVACFIMITTVEILSADALTATVDFTNVICFGDNNGTITITDPQNGSGNYEYSIDGGATWQITGDFTDLIAGEYIVMLRDADVPVNAVTLANITITQPVALYANVAFTNETYPGANDGTITVSSPIGGSGAYEYSINGTDWQDTGDFTDLAPGSYDVYIRDANAVDCFIMLTTVEILPADELSADVNFTNVTCFGDNDGTITISDPQNGSGNYEYSIDGGITWQDTGEYTGLIAGEYIVMLRDADIPVNSITLVTITVTEPDVLYADVAFTNETYPGANDGTITVNSPTGGSGDYEYSLDGTTWQDTGDFTDLTPGSYDVYIRDANAVDCFIMLTTVEILSADALMATVDFTNVTCFGDNDGTITITDPQNGSGNYEYKLDDEPWQSEGLFEGLAPGFYVVWMRDADENANEQELGVYEVMEPEQLFVEVTGTNPTTVGGTDGTVTTTVSGGTTPYTYLWSDGQITQSINNLTAGSYRVVVTDANGCTVSESITLTDPPQIICPENITVYNDSSLCGAELIIPEPEVISENFTVVWNDYNLTSNGSDYYPVGTTIVYWYVEDIFGNRDSCFMTVTVIDNEPPDLVCPGDYIITPSPDQCEMMVNVEMPLIYDNCGIEFVYNDRTGTTDASDVYPIGETVVNWTLIDIHGNMNECSCIVTVRSEVDAIDDFEDTNEDQPVNIYIVRNDLFCPSDYSLNSLSVAVDPMHGQAILSPADSMFVYYPDAGFSGTDQFMYRFENSWGYDDVATVTIIVYPINHPPVAADDYVTTDMNVPVYIFPLENDTDPDGNNLSISYLGMPVNGDTEQFDNEVKYSPYIGFAGEEALTYIVCDDGYPVLCDTATIYITITYVNYREYDLHVYNALTPNGDGINDTWKIKGIWQYPENEIMIMDRWGELVRTIRNYNNRENVWDGTNDQGYPLGNGDYYYIIKLKDGPLLKGWVYLHR